MMKNIILFFFVFSVSSLYSQIPTIDDSIKSNLGEKEVVEIEEIPQLDSLKLLYDQYDPIILNYETVSYGPYEIPLVNYERACRLFKGKQVLLRGSSSNRILDEISGKQIEPDKCLFNFNYNSFDKYSYMEMASKEIIKLEGNNVILSNGEKEAMPYYFCIDILFSKNKKLIAILENESKRFGIEIGDMISFNYDDFALNAIACNNKPLSKTKLSLYDISSRTTNSIFLKSEFENIVNIVIKKKKILEGQRQQLAEQEKKIEAEQIRKQKQALIAQYGDNFGNLIFAKKVAIGMNSEMCRKAWGTPLDIQTTTSSSETKAVWTYSYKTQLHFVNDKLVRIDN